MDILFSKRGQHALQRRFIRKEKRVVGVIPVERRREQWAHKGDMHSHNHAMFSGAACSLMTRLGGIRPSAPGFAAVEIAPSIPRSLSYVQATRQTPRGQVAVAWRRKDGSMALDIEVPPFTPAVLRLPGQPPRPLKAGLQQISVPDSFSNHGWPAGRRH